MNLTLSSGHMRSMRVLCTLREDILIRTAKTSEKDLGNAGPSL